MNDDDVDEPGALTRIGWFFWRNWNRAVCATRGHRLAGSCICQRCGLPIPTWTEIMRLRSALERIADPTGVVTADDLEWVVAAVIPKGSCPTGKRVYYAERLANRAITRAGERGEVGPLRHYKCPDCDWWHLATKFPVSKLPKVPCDDAAVERVALAIHEKNLHLSRATCRERAADYLRAAGETP